MNWFDTAGFANLAKSAFSSAQRTIDRALDIHEDKSTEVISVQLNEGEKVIQDEKIAVPYSSSTSSESPSPNIGDGNDAERLFASDSTKCKNSQNDQSSFDHNDKEELKHQAYCIEKSSDFRTTVFSQQPQQSCLFPSRKQSPIIEETWSENRVKEDEYGIESDAKIDVHLTVTQMLTGLTPFLSQTPSTVQQPLETKQPVSSDISLGKNYSDIPTEQEQSSHDKDACTSVDTSICAVKSNFCEDNKIDVEKAVTSCENFIKGSSGHDALIANNNTLESYLSIDSSVSNGNLDNSPHDKHAASCTSEKLTSASTVMLPTNSYEQMEFVVDKAYKSSGDWMMPFPCEPINEGNGDQTNIGNEIKELEVLELKECDIKSSDSLGSAETNSSSSFVKYSAGLSEVYSASDNSDVQKCECEHYSEHTSGEENETTSSDIEIISSPNGENGERHSSNHLKHTWLSRIYSRRSESPNSDSNFMPVVQEVEEDIHDQHLRPGFYEVRENSIDGEDDVEPSTETLMKEAPDIGEFVERQTVLEELVEDREKKLLKLSQEMAVLYDNNSRLEREIKRLEEIRNKDSQNTSEITQEFTQRIAQLEGKLFEATQERDIAKEKLEELEKEAHSRPCAAEVERIMKEKDQLITELMEEGEKLSKQQLQHSSLIKKLKNKDKEKENTLKVQKETLEEQAKEIERLRRSLGAKDDQEKKHIGTIRQLTITVQEKEADLIALREALEKVKEESNVMRKSLDNSYREMAELHRSNAEKEIQVQEIALSSELAAKGEFQQALENLKKEAAKERDTLLAELEQLQRAKIQAEQEAKCREDALQLEIIEIQKRLQESENHADELSKQISSATLPLLRQIDNLQSLLVSRSASWEKSEANLFERLNELQNQVLFSEAQEKLTQKNCDEFSSKLSDVCFQLSALKQEKTQLLSQLELAQMKIGMLEEAKNRECATVVSVKEDMIEEINRLKLEKDELSCQVASLQAELDIEKKKVQKLEEYFQSKIKSGGDKSSNGTSSPTMSRLSSVSERLQNWMQDSHSDGALGMTLSSYNHRSLYDTVRLESAPSLLENFQSQLKQRDGEIALLQSEIFKLEKIRDSLGQELADISSQYETLKTEFDEMKKIKADFSDMEQKYNTLLQMYGEKVEEAEELHLDLQDVKAMYRAQLDELLKKS